MTCIAGVTMQTTAKGKITKVTFDMKRWGHLLEDLLDRITVERSKTEENTPWSAIQKRLDKKHGITNG